MKWYQTQANFLGPEHWQSNFYICVGVWVGEFCVDVVKWVNFDGESWYEIRISNEVSDSSYINSIGTEQSDF